MFDQALDYLPSIPGETVEGGGSDPPGMDSFELADLEDAIETMVSREEAQFARLFDQLKANQRRLMVALAHRLPDESIYSAKFLRRFGFASSSSIHRVLKNLEGRNLIDNENGEYSIKDVVLKMWMRRRFPWTGRLEG